MSDKKAHSTLGASSSDRWINCPGSVALSTKAPPPRSSVYAEEGTKAHELLELILTNGLKSNFKASKDMSKAVNEAVEYIEAATSIESTRLVEQRVDLSFIDPDLFGTVDVAIVHEFDQLHVIDYKHGAGYAVDAENNTQMMYYALGIAHRFHYDFRTVKMTIIQPRAFHTDGPIRSWTIPIKDLIAFGDYLRVAVSETRMKSPRIAAGKWCKFCPAAVICPETNQKALSQARIDFDPLNDTHLPDPKDLAPDQISKILKASSVLGAWVSEVEAYALDLLKRGGEVKGFKLVPKRGSRKWANEDAVFEEAFKLAGAAALTDPELKSPAQLEKILGKDWVNARAPSVSSGETIAPSDDPRPAVNQLHNDFGKEYQNDKDEQKESGPKKGRTKKQNND